MAIKTQLALRKQELLSGEKKCNKKHWFYTKSLAEKALKKLRNNKTLSIKTVYFCTDCQLWHLTSMPKEQSRNFTRFLNNKNNKP